MLLYVRIRPEALTPNSTPLAALASMKLLLIVVALLVPATLIPSLLLPRAPPPRLVPMKLKMTAVEMELDNPMPSRPLPAMVFRLSTLPPMVTPVVVARKTPSCVLPRAFWPDRSVPMRLLRIMVLLEVTTWMPFIPLPEMRLPARLSPAGPPMMTPLAPVVTRMPSKAFGTLAVPARWCRSGNPGSRCCWVAAADLDAVARVAGITLLAASGYPRSDALAEHMHAVVAVAQGGGLGAVEPDVVVLIRGVLVLESMLTPLRVLPEMMLAAPAACRRWW